MTLLPVGTYVRVRENGPDPQPPYYAKVVGHDEVGVRYILGRCDGRIGGLWAFPAEVTKVTEAEAREVIL